MNSSKKPVYSWDACIFFAWLKGETCHPLADIAVVIEQIENEQAQLVVSVSAYAEVLCGALTANQAHDFSMVVKRPNITLFDVSVRVAAKAALIRNACLAEEPFRSVKLLDAYVIATAILSGADVLHTVDDGVLKLNGLAIVDNLAITKPCDISGQTVLLRPGD